MSTLVIKNLPEDLHARLKEQAERNRRSVTMEAVALIERGLSPVRKPLCLGPPIRLEGGPLKSGELQAWKVRGRK